MDSNSGLLDYETYALTTSPPPLPLNTETLRLLYIIREHRGRIGASNPAIPGSNLIAGKNLTAPKNIAILQPVIILKYGRMNCLQVSAGSGSIKLIHLIV